MKLSEILFEGIQEVPVSKLITSPRIEKQCTVGSFAVVQGNKIWKSNLLSIEDARAAVKTYQSILGPTKLRIVKIVQG
jgi:hypothetical protein